MPKSRRRYGSPHGAPGKLTRSQRAKVRPGRRSEPPGNECCGRRGNAGSEAYTVIAWGVGLSHGAPGDRQEVEGESPLR
jgi:hypothetical protein